MSHIATWLPEDFASAPTRLSAEFQERVLRHFQLMSHRPWVQVRLLLGLLSLRSTCLVAWKKGHASKRRSHAFHICSDHASFDVLLGAVCRHLSSRALV